MDFSSKDSTDCRTCSYDISRNYDVCTSNGGDDILWFGSGGYNMADGCTVFICRKIQPGIYETCAGEGIM